MENNSVNETVSPLHSDIIDISFSNGAINSNTSDHPYYVKTKGLCSFKPELTYKRYGVKASILLIGDICYTAGKEGLTEIKIISITAIEGEVKTYNLSKIANNNNYFANGVLIHNEQKKDRKKLDENHKKLRNEQ
ncbi:MAG: hypothetical protein HRT73_07485 [Flavobacteriales bacterium]|nr:hypothetical protein [Flavobacteriales bacterium]